MLLLNNVIQCTQLVKYNSVYNSYHLIRTVCIPYGVGASPEGHQQQDQIGKLFSKVFSNHVGLPLLTLADPLNLSLEKQLYALSRVRLVHRSYLVEMQLR
jgi:hypothetical protein